MPIIRSIARTSLLSLTAVLLAFATPAATLAEGACTPPPADQPGVHQPTGSDAGTFTYQCDGQYAGQWTNPYYVYNPATTSRTPTYNLDYQYNCTTGAWTKVKWDYSPGDGQFHQKRVAASDPGTATNCPVAEQSPAAKAAVASGISNTGPNSSSSTNLNGTSNSNTTNNTNATVNNTLTGVATSGNSLVLGNTTAGSATSGDVQNMANIVNMLQSSSNAFNDDGNLVVFTSNIDGDVNGDLFLDPSALSNVQNASSNTDLNSDVTVNNSVNASINNNINLDSTSGNAAVKNNTSGGDATSGSAKSIANVVNMINSAVQAGKSFLGVININGNLNGDILLPPDFVDQLLAANVPTVTLTGPNSTNTTNTTANSNTTVNNTNNLGINNNVNAKASTGNSKVSNNTSAGNATTGAASTNVTAFNLTGSSVVGDNDILVFVNVAGGKWVGLIVNAPAGATAASLGGHISASGPNSTNTSNTNVTSNATLNNNVNETINNNITANAKSGNATVSGNTSGGNAKSGDAQSAVNLLNVENSSLDLSGWFGVLFINVFGTWNGSFGINTSAGDPVAAAQAGGGSGSGGQSVGVPSQLFSFLPHTAASGSRSSYNVGPFSIYDNGDNSGASSASTPSALLAASTNKNAAAQKADVQHSMALPIVAIGLFVGYIAVERLYEFGRAKVRA